MRRGHAGRLRRLTLAERRQRRARNERRGRVPRDLGPPGATRAEFHRLGRQVAPVYRAAMLTKLGLPVSKAFRAAAVRAAGKLGS